MDRIPIRVRLTGWFVLMLAVLLVALGSFVAAALRADLTAEVDRSLTVSSAAIAQGYEEEGAGEFREATSEAIAAPSSRTLGAQVLTSQGVVVASSGDRLMDEPLLGRAAIASARAGSASTDALHAGPTRMHVRIISVPVTLAAPAATGDPRGVLVVAEPLTDVDHAVRRTTILLIAAGAVGLLVAGLGAWVVAGRALRPVGRMTTRAAAIDIGDLEQRVPVPRARDELNRLASTFNAMLERLQAGVATRERLIADASHELRAPLAAMLAELDVSLRHDDVPDASRAVLESLREEAARMARIVDNLLTMARIDDGHLALLRSPQDVTELARRSARAHAAAGASKGVGLEVTGPPAAVSCDRDRIEQVIGNLLDNAIRASPPGGRVRLDVATENGDVRLQVSDQGPGVPAGLREHVFERFARADPARGRSGGAGLGLAISREIAQAHGGRLELVRQDAPGSTFVLTLPAEAREATATSS